MSGLSVAGSEGPGAGVADVMDGDAEGWEPVAGGVVLWTGNEGSVAVVVTCWTGGVGSDGVCCGSGRLDWWWSADGLWRGRRRQRLGWRLCDWGKAE